MGKLFTDKDGNIVFIKDSEIRLRIKGHKRIRKLFSIHKPLNLIYCERKRKKHLHIKSDSYGFNWEVLMKAKSVENVLLKDELGMYLIPIKFIKDRGQFMHFAKKKFELQIFLPLEEINKYKTDERQYKNIMRGYQDIES